MSAICENAKCLYCVNKCEYRQLKLKSSLSALEPKDDKLYAFTLLHWAHWLLLESFFMGLTVSDHHVVSSWE